MTEQDWHNHLVESQQELRALLTPSAQDREAAGYGHTIREICQQPASWLDTASLVVWSNSVFAESLEGARQVVITGSGSSQTASECVAPAIDAGLSIPVTVVQGGAILTGPEQTLPAADPALMVSISRSGDSPESYAAIDLALSARPRMRHLVLTSNVNGRLATEFRLSDRVRVITLDQRTNDQSLVMTSSVTNLILGTRFLGLVGQSDLYKNIVAGLSRIAGKLLEKHTDAIARIARSGFRRVVYLGTGTRYGAAREAALKMLEITDGRVPVIAETYLSLRHGQMVFVQDDTLIVCFLSSTEPARAYELDLIRELNVKQLGSAKLVVGENIPADLLNSADCALECPGLQEAGDDNAPVIHVVAGQLLAFFRCLAEGLHPDAPSTRNVITRVVPGFHIHSSLSKERS